MCLSVKLLSYVLCSCVYHSIGLLSLVCVITQRSSDLAAAADMLHGERHGISRPLPFVALPRSCYSEFGLSIISDVLVRICDCFGHVRKDCDWASCLEDDRKLEAEGHSPAIVYEQMLTSPFILVLSSRMCHFKFIQIGEQLQTRCLRKRSMMQHWRLGSSTGCGEIRTPELAGNTFDLRFRSLGYCLLVYRAVCSTGCVCWFLYSLSLHRIGFMTSNWMRLLVSVFCVIASDWFHEFYCFNVGFYVRLLVSVFCVIESD